MRTTDEYKPGDATGPNFCKEIEADCGAMIELRDSISNWLFDYEFDIPYDAVQDLKKILKV